MTNSAEQLFTNVQPRTVAGRIVQFPLVRFVLAAFFLTPVFLLINLFSSYVDEDAGLTRGLISIAGTVLLYLFYRLYTRLIERREALEMKLTGAPAEFANGLAVGAGLMAAAVALLAMAGCYRIESFDFNWSMPTAAALWMGFHAFLEELIFRLIIFKLTEEALGSWVALIVQAALFGFLHLGNPNATLFSSAAIMVEAGGLLAAAFMLTRRMWLIFGMHLAWNFTQSTVFGIAVSGHESEGIITPTINGPDWLTGGAFGLEASWPAIVFCLAAGLWYLRKAIKSGQLVAPVWRRSRPSPLFPNDAA